MTDLDLILNQSIFAKANVPEPAGLEQRLLAHVLQATEPAPTPALFTSSQRMTPKRGVAGTWTALGLHAVAILLIAVLARTHMNATKQILGVKELTTLTVPPPPVAPQAKAIGGGGGQHDVGPVTQGHLPKLATEQITPPKAPPLDQPKLAVEPTVVVQKNLELADNKLPNFGAPNSTLKGFSLGNGSGTGIGSGNGNGIGPGSGGNIGGGIMHVGGSVKAPLLIHQVEPEFSEEARKAKFSGNVVVTLIIDEQGLPSHVHCARDIGMGLCDKAVDAVRQYTFKPATQNGKAVKVQMNVEVAFQIF